MSSIPRLARRSEKFRLQKRAEVNAAIEAAAAAFPEWRRTPPEDRIQPLFKLKMLLEEHLDELGRLITIENGKTVTEAKAELRSAIENVEVACGIPMMMQGYNLEDVARGIDETMIRQPMGVVAAITAFNFPAMIPFWFLPYAIATGNTFVLKRSERVPLTMKRVFELLEQDRLAQRRRQHGQRRKDRRGHPSRSSESARGEFCRLDAGGEIHLRARRGQRKARAMPGRREKSGHCACRTPT